jgi:GPH family glycoside/pentoside/hexuronide:cation symporter
VDVGLKRNGILMVVGDKRQGRDRAAAQPVQVGAKERHVYGLYFLGQNITYFVPYLFLSAYLLMCGISAGAVAGVMLATKIWDACNDAIFGVMLDKIRFKRIHGRYLPWLRISILPICLMTYLLFSIPMTLPVSARIVWYVVTYVLWDMSYTLCDTPAFALVTTMTNDQAERTHLQTTSRIYANIGMCLAVGIGNVLTSEAVGMSFTQAALIGVVVALICMLPIAFIGKERVHVESRAEESYSFKQMFSYIRRNKYLLIYYLGAFFQLGLNTMPVVVMFACYYYFDSALLATLFTGLSYVSGVFAGFILPLLLKRYEKYQVFMVANIIYAACGVAIWLVGPVLWPHVVLSVVRGLAYGFDSVMMFMFTPDCAEYGQYTTGFDARGITFAIQTFTEKLNSAVASAVGVGVLGLFGWQSVEASDFAALKALGIMQSSTALQGLWISYTLIPALGAVLAVLCWSRYKLREKDVDLMAKCNSGQISREECEEGLNPNL